jgi:signal transduction histidine kinase
VNSEWERDAAKVSKLEALAAVARSARPLEVLVGLVLEQVAEVVRLDAAAVWLYSSDNDLWYIGGSRGLTWRAAQVRFRGSQALHGRTAEEGEIIADLNAAGFRRLYPEHERIHGALYAPMTISGKRVGLLALYRNDHEPFTEEDLRFARTVGTHVGVAISFAALEARSERLAVAEERARLGADLHDGVLQILSAVRVYASELLDEHDHPRAAAAGTGSSRIRDLAIEIQRCVDTGSEEIATAIERLRRPDTTVDVARGLELARERLQNAGIATELVYELDDLPPEVSDALTWIAREAASNILQHSAARAVAIELRATGPVVELVITDDGGAGSSSLEGDGGIRLGQGLMRERAEQLGGTLTIESRPGGVRVHARIPVAAPPSRLHGGVVPEVDAAEL